MAVLHRHPQASAPASHQRADELGSESSRRPMIDLLPLVIQIIPDLWHKPFLPLEEHRTYIPPHLSKSTSLVLLLADICADVDVPKQTKALVPIQGKKTFATVGVSCSAFISFQPDRTHAARTSENPLGSNCEWVSVIFVKWDIKGIPWWLKRLVCHSSTVHYDVHAI